MTNKNSLITDPVISAKQPHKYLGILSMVWVSILIIGILTSLKTFSLGSVVFSVGVIAYPLVYLFADIFTEVYGYRVTRKIVWTGFACLILVTTIASLYTFVPASDSFVDGDAFNLIFRASPLVALVGVIAFFSGEITNSYIVAKLKLITKGKHKWLRLISSTFFGQLIDNAIFFTGALLIAGWYTPSELFPLVVSTVLFCTVWETLALPITYRVIAYIKQKEGLDTYDHGTNFNPFGF